MLHNVEVSSLHLLWIFAASTWHCKYGLSVSAADMYRVLKEFELFATVLLCATMRHATQLSLVSR